MRLLFFIVLVFALLLIPAPGLQGQWELSGTAQIQQALAALTTTGSVLMIAAHPDDENTALLAYFARGRNARTAYLSLTRGEGGQNLVGPEQGPELGVIRTQELLAARRIDGASQLFTRAIDFGFSKTAEETLAKWGHQEVLSDVVWNIRRFRPDVIILRFSGTSRDGHGHHQCSAMLGKEAFFAAADPAKFPEQLKWVQPWKAKRVFFNVFSFTREQEKEAAGLSTALEIDTGEYNPVLGRSYSEIAGLSRSMHKSQGFGAAQRRGPVKNYLTLVAGEQAAKDPLDGVDTSWGRIAGGAAVGELLARAAQSFQPEHPERTVPLLLEARRMVRAIQAPLAKYKLEEIDEAIALCAGLWLDAAAGRYEAVPGSDLKIALTAINRSRAKISVEAMSVEDQSVPGERVKLEYNQPHVRNIQFHVPAQQAYSQPYWLAKPVQGALYSVPDQKLIGVPENPPALRARFRLRAGQEAIEITRPVHYRYVDSLRGEVIRPLAIVPPVAVQVSAVPLVFPDAQPRATEVRVRANVANSSGRIEWTLPSGWRAEPVQAYYRIGEPGESTVLRFTITPPAGDARAEAIAAAHTTDGRTVSQGGRTIDYPHIPPQALFPPSTLSLVRADIRMLSKRIGYIEGAGDEVAEALAAVGYEVTLLTPQDLTAGDLGRFDAIVTGVRAYDVRPDLDTNRARLLRYVEEGGTLVVQYNKLESERRRPSGFALAPYPMTIGWARVSVEDAPVAFPDPESLLLAKPNRITPADFNNWVQERGLYFATKWDPRYKTLFSSHDPGEEPLEGGTLYTPLGKGAYVFTAYSWFRQLPAGVPGAFRIFSNLLSAGKTLYDQTHR